MAKIPPAVWEAWVRSLGWDDPLEENSIDSVTKSDQHDGLFSPKWGKKLSEEMDTLSLGTRRNELYRQKVIVKEHDA